MPYHSRHNSSAPPADAVPIFPLRAPARGPATPCSGPDIIDDALEYFRANVLFRGFEVQGKADLILIYVTIFIQQCLRKLDAQRSVSKLEAEKVLVALAIADQQPIPGSPGWPLEGVLSAPALEQDAG